MLVACTSGTAMADAVTSWNDAFLDGLRTTRGWAPPQLARAGAIVHSAIYDAVNSASPFANPYKTFITVPGADPRAAAVESGYRTMSALFGSGIGNATFQTQLDARRTADLALIPDGAGKTAGLGLGQQVATNILNIRAGDGSNGSNAFTPGTASGDWRPDYPGGVPGVGVGAQYRNVTPWTMASPSQFRPPACPPTSSPEYLASYNQVKSLGSATSATRTADQTRLAWFWGNDRDGTFKPPGHYNLMARTVAQTQATTMGAEGSLERLQNNARLMALVNVAQADAGIAAWDAKYPPSSAGQAFWRPITAIRLGESDDNPATVGDPNWAPLSHAGVGGGPYTPGFPAYVSGHATFGAATAAILRTFFGTDNITFSLRTDDADFHALMGNDPNATWTYTSLSQAVFDNNMSRVWLGVHWDFDATLGQSVGENVAAYVLSTTFTIPAPGAAGVLASAGVLVLRRRRR
jgi:hypothetical protein